MPGSCWGSMRPCSAVAADLLDLGFGESCWYPAGSGLELGAVDLFDECVAIGEGESLFVIVGRGWKADVRSPQTVRRQALMFVSRTSRFELVRQELLQELQRRRVVEHLRADAAAAAPGRGDDHRHAVAEADRAVAAIPTAACASAPFASDVLEGWCRCPARRVRSPAGAGAGATNGGTWSK